MISVVLWCQLKLHNHKRFSSTIKNRYCFGSICSFLGIAKLVQNQHLDSQNENRGILPHNLQQDTHNNRTGNNGYRSQKEEYDPREKFWNPLTQMRTIYLYFRFFGKKLHFVSVLIHLTTQLSLVKKRLYNQRSVSSCMTRRSLAPK